MRYLDCSGGPTDSKNNTAQFHESDVLKSTGRILLFQILTNTDAVKLQKYVKGEVGKRLVVSIVAQIFWRRQRETLYCWSRTLAGVI